jgi:hypothetical protein
VFNIKDFSGGGTLKNGSRWRDYGSVLESAQDFTELMKDKRYAPGLAKARTPRQALEAIAAAGYAGGESTYVDKVLRVMRGQGVNVDQPFAPTSSPTRNQGHMTPTLAYITSDIGPTSTGEHLDVKDVTGARFQENALDNFVEVADPEFGRISLGSLKQKLPGRGDSFDQHLARGSHGIDYPLLLRAVNCSLKMEPESLVKLRLFTVTKLLFNCLMAGVSVSYMVKLHDTIPLLY